MGNYEDVIKSLESKLVDELAKEIDEKIILDILYPDTKGISIIERRKIIKRQNRIDEILGDESIKLVTIDERFTISNLTDQTVDIANHFQKKTFTLVTDLSKPGFVWAPYLVNHSVPIVFDGQVKSSHYNKNISSKYYTNI